MFSTFYDDLWRDKFKIMTDYSFSCIPHYHSCLELGYIIDNSGVHSFDDESAHFSAGQYFIVDYGVKHWYKSINGKKIGVINFLFFPEFFDSALQGCKSLNAMLNNYLMRFSATGLPDRPINRLFTDDGTVRKLLEECISEFNKKSTGYIEVIRCNLIKIIFLTMRKIDMAEPENCRIADMVMQEIGENLNSGITLSKIAEKLHFSLPYISAKFKEETGKTFCEAVKKARVEAACRYVTTTDKKMSEIAALTGFSDQKTFYKSFREIMGVTPNTFRNAPNKIR